MDFTPVIIIMVQQIYSTVTKYSQFDNKIRIS